MVIIPEKLKRDGFRFALCKEKRAVEKAWTRANNYKFNDQKLLDWNDNYGILGGRGNLCILDFDDQAAQDKIIKLLPSTFQVRTGGKGFLHCYYITEDKPKTVHVDSEDNKRLLDIIGPGCMAIAPGSKNPTTGKTYDVVNDIDIAKVSFEKIIDIVETIGRIREIREKAEHTILPEFQDPLIAKIKAHSRGKIRAVLNEFGIDTTAPGGLSACPMHESIKNKCLHRDDEKGIWHCFHCDQGGDVISLLKLAKGFSFIEAREWLIKFTGIKTETEDQVIISDPEGSIKTFNTSYPYFYDCSGYYWIWDNATFSYKITDELSIMTAIMMKYGLGNSFLKSKVWGEFIRALETFGRDRSLKMKIPPTEWIQFGSKIFDLKTKEFLNPDPSYFMTNSIPWELGEISETPILDGLFKDWVGSSDFKVLYEILAYCCLRAYPIHSIFVLIGAGRNGKSTFLSLANKFLGTDNISTSELDELVSGRFEKAQLYKKLVCCIGETNFNKIERTGILKRLTGEDNIKFEEKFKKPVNATNYAKILMATNELPRTEDLSDGFFRRFMIIDFPNIFKEGRDILSEIPGHEYKNLARKITTILPGLLARGEFHKQGTIEERKERYIMSSNPFELFMESHCAVAPKEEVLVDELYIAYFDFLNELKKRKISQRRFRDLLQERYVIENRMVDGRRGYWISGLGLKKKSAKEALSKPEEVELKI